MPPRRVQVYLAKKDSTLAKRLPYFFLSNILQENIQKVDTLPGIQNNHSLVLVQLRNLYEEKHGPSSWKFNNSLLSDTEYVEAMNSELLTILNEQHDKESDPRKLWNLLNTMLENFLFSILGQSLSVCEKEDKIWKNQ